MEKLITLENVSKHFHVGRKQTLVAVNNVSMDIYKGRFVRKTSLLYLTWEKATKLHAGVYIRIFQIKRRKISNGEINHTRKRIITFPCGT